MEVKDKIMYHFHKKGIYDEKWEIGNELIVDNNFVSYFCDILNEFNTAVICDKNGQLQSLDRIIKHYLKDENFDKIDRKLAKQMMLDARKIIINANIFKRELALEEYRKQLYPNLPSRLHSIWVTGENQLDFWEDQLNENDIELYELQLNGNLFKSSDTYIPDDYLSVREINEIAKNYWNPTFANEEDENKAEYLFQGKVKIIRKINKLSKNK